MSNEVPDWVWVERRFEYNEYLWRLDKKDLINIINQITDKIKERELTVTDEVIRQEIIGEENGE